MNSFKITWYIFSTFHQVPTFTYQRQNSIHEFECVKNLSSTVVSIWYPICLIYLLITLFYFRCTNIWDACWWISFPRRWRGRGIWQYCQWWSQISKIPFLRGYCHHATGNITFYTFWDDHWSWYLQSCN